MQVLHHPTPSGVTALDSSSGSGSSGSSSSADGSANITANDFLSLLVAEMKNQDPTADTDPNAYIDQLVQVNSLQQLIQINQDLSGLGSTSNTNSDTSSQAVSAASRLATSLAPKQVHTESSDTNPAPQTQVAALPKTEVHQS